MMRHFFIILSMLLGACPVGQAQAVEVANTAQPYRFLVAPDKTTHLVFPYAIKSIDRGSAELLAEPVADVSNVLRVKAATPRMRDTNLTVITADGHLYAFDVSYAARPSAAILRVDEHGWAAEQGALFAKPGQNVAHLQAGARLAAGAQGLTRGRQRQHQGVTLELQGIYLQEEVMYFRIRIRNASPISYDVDQLRFFVRDRKPGKRTAWQERELKPLYTEGQVSRIAGASARVLVYALPKHTLPPDQYLFVHLMEQNGGRHLKLKVTPSFLRKAKVLCSLKPAQP